MDVMSGLLDLIVFGVGVVIGTGVFVLTGDQSYVEAASDGGSSRDDQDPTGRMGAPHPCQVAIYGCSQLAAAG